MDLMHTKREKPKSRRRRRRSSAHGERCVDDGAAAIGKLERALDKAEAYVSKEHIA
ncbi:hypothetical protein C2845_PM13G24660 [Panicum miliaceum]|uniref:Uncharacterized protein n=1 Tax=Panicum miliaceum TaxID=4540 RepID=A0A3L6RG31_PANMI|nr:hypothetical protein C2845_PM13G24660 [Panicum miliaceum]